MKKVSFEKKDTICGSQFLQAARLIKPETNDPRRLAWARAVDRPLAMVTVSRPMMDLGMGRLSELSLEAEEKVIAHPTPRDDEWYKLVDEAMARQHKLSQSISFTLLIPSSIIKERDVRKEGLPGGQMGGREVGVDRKDCGNADENLDLW